MGDKDSKVSNGNRVHIPVQNIGQSSSWARNCSWRESSPAAAVMIHSTSKWSSRYKLPWKIMRSHLDPSFENGNSSYNLFFLPDPPCSAQWERCPTEGRLTVSWVVVCDRIENPSLWWSYPRENSPLKICLDAEEYSPQTHHAGACDCAGWVQEYLAELDTGRENSALSLRQSWRCFSGHQNPNTE